MCLCLIYVHKTASSNVFHGRYFGARDTLRCLALATVLECVHGDRELHKAHMICQAHHDTAKALGSQ